MKRKSESVDCRVPVTSCDGKRCRLDVDAEFLSTPLVDYSFSDSEADDTSFCMDDVVKSPVSSFKANTQNKSCSCVFCETFNGNRFRPCVEREETFNQTLKNLHANLKTLAVASPSKFNQFVCQTITYMDSRGSLQTSRGEGDDCRGSIDSTVSTVSKKGEVVHAVAIRSKDVRIPTVQPRKVNRVVKFGTHFIRWIRRQKQSKKLRANPTEKAN